MYIIVQVKECGDILQYFFFCVGSNPTDNGQNRTDHGSHAHAQKGNKLNAKRKQRLDNEQQWSMVSFFAFFFHENCPLRGFLVGEKKICSSSCLDKMVETHIEEWGGKCNSQLNCVLVVGSVRWIRLHEIQRTMCKWNKIKMCLCKWCISIQHRTNWWAWRSNCSCVNQPWNGCRSSMRRAHVHDKAIYATQIGDLLIGS